ncbi:HAMP domain-containing histidine kinase [Patescibacteria group bacterium]|nr:HAMP domain-containing histidine kinase [Patescibacteria group bacterium]
MFQSARIKLTARYLLIIMIVSLLFSFAIYSGINVELNRFERLQKLRLNQLGQAGQAIIIQPSDPQMGVRGQTIQRVLIPPPDYIDPEIVNHARTRIILILVMINLSILFFSGIAGYILAGQTLQPIQEMMDEQNRFVTDSSHELRTPLTALRSEIEVHLRDKKLTLAATKALLESNLEEVKNLQRLSDNLIRLTQYESNPIAEKFEKVSLTAIVEDAVKKVLPLAKNKKITIKQQLPDVSFEGNSATLSELFVILLDNAIKYSEPKTIIEVTGQRTDHHLKVEVTDHGMGIDAKDLPFIFGRFYRTDKSRTQSQTQGYGLGLSIAKQIVERHHGTISANSVPQQGTTFTIQLPLKHPSALL